MQSCSKYNELPLNAKLLTSHTNFFLINDKYNKVSSFFFCADFDLRRFWLAVAPKCPESLKSGYYYTCLANFFRYIVPCQSVAMIHFETTQKEIALQVGYAWLKTTAENLNNARVL